MNCPGCGKPLFLPGALGTWHDHHTGRLLVVYAICPECMSKLEGASEEERKAYAMAWERAIRGEPLH
jgi:uncharacterized Zn finger protein (UPF0148 family)